MSGLCPYRTNDREDERLKRIVAMLLSFATLAECAVARSLPVRMVLFWILRQAELAASALFMNPTDEFCAQMPAPCDSGEDGCCQSGLIRLAISFRIMAALLIDELSFPARTGDRPIMPHTMVIGIRFHLCSAARGVGRVVLNDTS